MASSLPFEVTTDLSAGMLDAAAPTAYPTNAVAAALNARIEPDATMSRRPGSMRTHPTALNGGAVGYGAASFVTAAGDAQVVAIFGDTAYVSADGGATWTAAATGLREDYWSFATMRVGATNYLFAANGDTTIQRWDGATWDTCPNAPSGVKYVAVFNGRLYATGHSGVLVQATAIGDPTLWSSPDGLTVQVLTAPTAMYQIGPHLLVADEDATSYIDGYGEQTVIVETGATGFSRSVGCVAFRTMVAVGDNAVCWLSKRGVEYYSPNTGIMLVSKSVMAFQKGIDWSAVVAHPGMPSAAYDAIEQNYHVAVSTDGARNNRTLVLNLLDTVQGQRPGPRGSPTIDQVLAGNAVLLADDGHGYLSNSPNGVEAAADANGYLSLGHVGIGGATLVGDSDGYLATEANDAVPATLFIAPTIYRAGAIHSLGYDGFVRRHADVDLDDELSDGTGGTPVTLILRSRPFLFGNARQRKRARIVHLASAQDGPATIGVRVLGGGVTAQQFVSVPPTALGEAHRTRTMVYLDADAPQVELTSTDAVKISLVGLSAQPLRERA